MRLFLSALLLILAIGTTAIGQATIYVPNNSVASGAGNLIPLWTNSGAAWTYAARIPASYLAPVYGLRRLNDISFVPDPNGTTPWTTSTWTSGSLRIGVGHVPTPLPIPFSFPFGAAIGSFLDFTLLYDSATSGPLTWNVSSGMWSPLGFGSIGGTSFCWDGTHDVAVYITTQGATASGGFSGACSQSTTEPVRVYANAFGAATSTGSGAGGLKMKLDFLACGGVPAQYETNDAASSLDLNGIQGTNFLPAIGRVCTSATVSVNSASSGVGLPWEVAFNLAPVAPRALISASGQIVNLNLGNGLLFLFGGTVPAFVPFPGNFGTAFPASASAGVISFQQLNGNPGHPDGFSLSQACELDTGAFNPTLPAPGPTCDDCAVQINVGCMNGLFGRTYSSLFVQSNGRLMFGGGNSTPTPSVNVFLADPPSFGVWADFSPAGPGNPTGLGTVTVSQPTANEIRVDYVGVAYRNTQIANTFALIYSRQNGVATISGLQGLLPTIGTHQMLLGLSGGSVVGATSSGPAVFGPAPSAGATYNPTDALYAIGLAGTINAGMNQIIFAPNAYGNYDWISN